MNKQYTPIDWSKFNPEKLTPIGSNQYTSAELETDDIPISECNFVNIAINGIIQPTDLSDSID